MRWEDWTCFAPLSRNRRRRSSSHVHATASAQFYGLNIRLVVFKQLLVVYSFRRVKIVFFFNHHLCVIIQQFTYIIIIITFIKTKTELNSFGHSGLMYIEYNNSIIYWGKYKILSKTLDLSSSLFFRTSHIQEQLCCAHH